MDRRVSSVLRVRRSPLSLAVSLAALGLLTSLSSSDLLAACTPGVPTNGVTVTCTGNDQQSFNSAASNLTFNIGVGSILSTNGSGDPVLQLTGSNYTIYNSGQIYPSNNGQQSLLTTGLKVGNNFSQNISITNNTTGRISGTGANLGASIANLKGMALDVQSGPGGKVTLVNNGTIFADAIVGATLEVADMPNVAVYGGAQVEMTNTNQLYGRVAFQASNEGNIFTNSSTLAGSLSLGAGGGANRFNAITGSAVVNGGVSGTGSVTVDSNPNLVFVKPGVVDGGAGGSNTLALQNAIGGGSGTAGSGTISATGYVNFSNLLVQAGSWQVSGALLSGATTSTSLTGGSLSVDNDAVFGSGDVSINGANLTTHTATVNLANNFLIGSAGMALSGTNTIILNGVVSGGATGALTKNNGGILRINGVNTYAGGTVLNGGTTVVSTNQAFGTGGIAIGAIGARIDASGSVNLANNINLTGNGTFGGTGSLTLSGIVSDTTSRSISKVGSGQLTLASANTYQGGTALSGGTLVVGNNQALGSGTLTVSSASTLASTQPVTLSNAVNLASNLTIAGANDLRINGVIGSTGAFKLIKTGSGNLTLSAANTFSGGVDLNSGTLTVATNGGALGSGTLTATGNSRLVFDTALNTSTAIVINSGMTLDLGINQDILLFNALSGAGNLTKTGTGEVKLFQTGTLGGQVDVQAGKVTSLAANALGSGTAVNIASGAILSLGADTALGALSGSGQLQVTGGAISVGSDNTSSTFSGVISGSTLSGLNKLGSGTLTLSGNNTFTSSTNIGAGRLNIASGGRLASNLVTVASGATVGGSGTLTGGLTINNGGHLALSSGSTLNSGSLTLSSGSIVDIALGAPTIATPMGNVNGNIVISASPTFNFTDAGNLENGNYRLFDYSGTLTYTGGSLGTVPAGFLPGEITLDISQGNTINVVVNSAALATQYWDGAGTYGDGVINGGTGVWNSAESNWTKASGTSINNWKGVSAAFQGSAGLVIIEGTQTASSLQFKTDGYTLSSAAGGQLSLANATSGKASISVDSGVSTLIDAQIGGSGTLEKTGTGTLVLAGSNTYSGGTALTAGTLIVRGNGVLGSGALSLASGTFLRADNANTQLNNAVNLAGVSNVVVDSGTSLSLNGSLGGAGGLVKVGTGTLVLNGINSQLGDTWLSAGGLVIGSSLALGSGTLNTLNTTTLDSSLQGASIANNVAMSGNLTVLGSGDMSLNGTVSGTGNLIKAGGSALNLTGANTLNGTVMLNQGILRLGQNTSLGNTTLAVGGVSSLQSLADISVDNAVSLNAELSVIGANDLTLAGVVSGMGGLRKDGSGTLSLATANLYQGNTTLQAGTLNLGNAGALGSGRLDVTGTAALQSGSALTVGNAVTISGNLSVQGSNNLTLSGNLSGMGSLIKAGSGTLLLSGNNTLNGNTHVNAGTLQVNGTLGAGNVSVFNGATLAGSGSLGGAVTVENGGHLSLAGSSVLTLGSLVLNDTSNLDTTLGIATPGAAGLANVTGDLTLDGRLNITDTGGFGIGVYRLFDYGGLLTDNGLQLGTLSTGIAGNELELQTSLANQVNLVVGGTSAIRFWDGSELTGNGSVEGGNGVWNSTDSNWTTTNAGYNGAWNDSFAVFQGTAGTVIVEGTQQVTGVQFVSDGYTLAGGNAGQLQLVNGIGGYSAVRVGNGATATLDVALGGSGLLTKVDNGTLVLNGTNTYTGGTRLIGGTLVVGNDAALGSGSLTVQDGTVLDSNTSVNLGNSVVLNGELSLAGSQDLTLSGALSGTGSLIKQGTGTVDLAGSNAFNGPYQVDNGRLNLLSSNASAISQVVVASVGTLGVVASNAVDQLSGQGSIVLANNSQLGVASGNYAGAISGSGSLNKTGAGNLALSGVSAISGRTTVSQGSLSITGQGVLGTSILTVANGASLGGNGRIDGAVTIADGGHLLINNSATLSTGNLTLDAGANLDASLGASVVGASGMLKVNGDLVLDGTLNVTDVGGFGPGVYRLMDYTGSLTNNGLLFGNVPANDLQLQTVLGKQINLLVTAPDTDVQFWNGTQQVGNGVIAGGSGTWGSNSNWTNVDGTSSQRWASSFAVFQGAAGTVTVEGAQTVSGLQFASDGYRLQSGTAGSLNLVNGAQGNASMRVDANSTATLDVALTGSGTLGKYDSGTLVLNGANSYTGGTLLNGGTLVLGHDSALGNGGLIAAGGTTLDNNAALSLGNAVTLNGALTLAGSNDLNLSGVISGSGSLIKQGASSLTLSGDNSFSGALNVLDGSLTLVGSNALGNASLNVSDTAAVSVGGLTQLDALSGAGDLALAAGSQLQVGSNNASSVYDGNLSGAGSLVKAGSGKLVLNGNSSVGGGTQVSAGSLIIGGAAGSTASLTSDVQVANGAMLGGHGNIIGRLDLVSGATLNPGNSIGTLRVNGDVNLAAGSILEIEANPDGSSDKLISTGSVSLAGANLKVLAGAGDWAPSTSYGIIQAAAINGTFADVSSNLAFLTPVVAYSATGVQLTLERNEVSFVSVGRTFNQRAAAAGVESLASGDLYTTISALSVEQAQAAYDSLSGELHASTQGALFDDARYVRDAIGQRLRAVQGQASTDAVLHTDADSGITYWLQGYGGWGDQSANSNTARLDHNSSGTVLGVDLPVGDNWRVGVAAGYGSSKLDVDARNASAEIDSTSLSLFAAGQWDAVNLRLGASQAWNRIDSSRHVQAGGIAEHDKAHYDANTTQVFGELGYAIRAGDFTVEPFAGLAHVKVDSDSFKEHGGSTALAGKGEKDELSYGTLGLHASTAFTTVGSVPLALQGTLGWQHAFDDLDPQRQLSFARSQSFTVKGAPLAQDTALAQLGVTAQIACGTTVDLGYSGQFGDGYKDNGVRLGLNVSF